MKEFCMDPKHRHEKKEKTLCCFIQTFIKQISRVWLYLKEVSKELEPADLEEITDNQTVLKKTDVPNADAKEYDLNHQLLDHSLLRRYL